MNQATTIGLYHPARSVVHATPAGYKMLALLVGVLAVLFWHTWWELTIAALITVGLYALARIPWPVAWKQLRPLRYLLIIVAGLQWWLVGWEMAVTVCGTILVTVALAALVTLTTRVSEMLDVASTVLRPLRRLGVNPDRVGLLFAITIRCIPLVVGIVTAVTEARKSRGLGFSLTALAAPVVVQSLRAADALGDALVARGADD